MTLRIPHTQVCDIMPTQILSRLLSLHEFFKLIRFSVAFFCLTSSCPYLLCKAWPDFCLKKREREKKNTIYASVISWDTSGSSCGAFHKVVNFETITSAVSDTVLTQLNRNDFLSVFKGVLSKSADMYNPNFTTVRLSLLHLFIYVTIVA